MDLVIVIIIVILVFLLFNLKVFNLDDDRVYYKPIGGEDPYYIRDRKDKTKAYEKINRLNGDLDKIRDDFQKFKLNYPRYPKIPDINRFLKRTENIRIDETYTDFGDAGVTIDKKNINICVRKKDSPDKFENMCVSTYILLHELAHVMCKSYNGHNEEFWDNFAFIMARAIKLGIYKYQNFQDKPIKYCGIDINFNKPSLEDVNEYSF